MKKDVTEKPFSIRIGKLGDFPLIALEGDVNTADAAQLKNEIIKLFESEETILVFDMTQVTFLDSSALAVFIAALKHLRTVDGIMVIAGPTTRILRVFEITGLDRIFDIKDTVGEAEEFIADEKAKAQTEARAQTNVKARTKKTKVKTK